MTDQTIPPCPVCGTVPEHHDSETVEQLKTRLAPDPRVALLDALGVKGKKNLICLLSGVVPHKYINEAIDKLIAAQRGEVDG